MRQTESPGLAGLRAELDLLDAALREAVRRRIEHCVRIGHFKREHGVPVMQPDRMGLVQERAESYAVQHGLDPEFFRRLYDLIIAEACRLEDLAIAEADAGHP